MTTPFLMPIEPPIARCDEIDELFSDNILREYLDCFRKREYSDENVIDNQ